MHPIVRSQWADVPLLSAMLARAFAHDPLYEYVFPDATVREVGTAWDMAGLLRYGIRHGEVLAAPDLAACAVWLPPGRTEFTQERMSEAGMLDGVSHIGQDADRRLNEFVRASEDYHRRVAPDRHWYLVVLGVQPELHSRGIGGGLLAVTLRKADQQRLPVYLETVNPGNLAFYKRRGFSVRAEAPLPQGTLTVWYMLRDPTQ